MSSRVLYPPILDSYMPAFQAGNNSYCRVYFSLSKFNAASDFTSLHVSITKQNNGINVVNTKDDPTINHYRATGIILNMAFRQVEDKDNLYYFDILNSDLSSKDNNIGSGYEGWIPGWIYKIQIRLSGKNYDGSVGQAAWLNSNSSAFSEWSTVCIVKAIGKMDLIIPPFGYSSSNENETNLNNDTNTLYLSTLDFFGKIISEDTSEVLYKYNFKLYDTNFVLLEDSGELFSNQYQNSNEFRYLVKYEFEDNENYNLEFTYETNNGFSYTYKLNFNISLIQVDRINCQLLTAENDAESIMENLTTVHEEEEEGRIMLKLYSPENIIYTGNICIRRSSSKDNFKEWFDIKILNIKNDLINELPYFYDYTIESGVWYKYGVQSIDKNGDRGILNILPPIMRDFQYSFLLGENNQQLKLMFNNTMGSYKIQLMESKIETIGGTYPIVTRNSALNYKVFPINGLISFWMDEYNTFCDKKVIYNNSQNIVDLYSQYNIDKGYTGVQYQDFQYDYIYERDFRQLVLNFLHDGKPKLFKSPTEGNIIVRLTDINCVPNQSLDRMIYEFSSTGNEFAEAIYANFIKYNFLEVGEINQDLSTKEIRIGQIQMAFTPQTNIFNEIYKKYDSQNTNYAGYSRVLKGINHIKITIEDKPLRIRNSANEIVSGNNMTLNNSLITIYGNQRIYEFDSRLVYTRNDKLYLLGDAEGINQTVNATVDFLYELQLEKFVARDVQSRQISSGIGQIFGEYKSGASLYNEILHKYLIEWSDSFRQLNTISSIEIEANPGTVFLIKDEDDLVAEQHEINDTGTLRFYELNNIKEIKYLGKRNKITGEIETSFPENILMNYYFTVIKGTYKGE